MINLDSMHAPAATVGVVGVFLDATTIITKANVTFVTGLVLTILAATYYFLQIQKLVREKRKTKRCCNDKCNSKDKKVPNS